MELASFLARAGNLTLRCYAYIHIGLGRKDESILVLYVPGARYDATPALANIAYGFLMLMSSLNITYQLLNIRTRPEKSGFAFLFVYGLPNFGQNS